MSAVCFCGHSQQDQNEFWKKVRYGGGLGLNFGNGFFSATIAPSAIYQFDEQFALGLGLNATFNNQKDIFKTTVLGGSLIGLYNVIPEIQLSGEFEQLNVSRRYDININAEDDNYWSPALFLGAGYRSGNVIVGVRYNVLHDSDKSIYIDPWVPFIRFFF
ncbi:alpha-ketoglutarate decarboxylase [Hyunsoonleella sp. SJ7]|uniref:Alpha-ketoglutarate decarboxylase n=1 Tax=Hyunsoonleella aquatilis TaxID=2762758 RepID=A0A923HBB5_9FLAO|nr:alpha-ketoglutarate decarboxylase [Hyunsoonleella aquatilis]